MESNIKEEQLVISGMTCISCQNKIERRLLSKKGILSANVSYSTGIAHIRYDTNKISLDQISKEIEVLKYQVIVGKVANKTDVRNTISMLAIIVSLYILLEHFGILNILVPSQLADTKMGYGMLFVIGLITSIHCIAMCGGINLSQCIPSSEAAAKNQSKFSTFLPSFLYNLGRVISYTAVGFILGLVGWLFGGGSSAGVPTLIQGILKLVAGIFMVVMGLNMLNLFPALRKLNPRLPRIFSPKAENENTQSKGPFFVGLLNGFMPCGPLQSMQIVAIATANPFAGAFSMFVFSLGTVPLMLGLGSLVSALGKKFAKSVMTVGAVLVVVLGLAMISQGGSLSGLFSENLLLPILIVLSSTGIISNLSFRKHNRKIIAILATLFVGVFIVFSLRPYSPSNTNDNNIQVENGEQIIESRLSSRGYPNITVKVGVPVKWNIDAPSGSINGCNNRMFIKEYGIEHTFTTGENIIEFTPTKTGTFRYNCWMGMIRATITVVESDEDLESLQNDYDSNTLLQVPEPVPSGYKIPTDSINVAKVIGSEEPFPVQEISTVLTEEGLNSSILVVQSDTTVQWNIESTLDEETQLSVPLYYAQYPLNRGKMPFYFQPIESFVFSIGSVFGYVKVVEDINSIDIDAIKKEVALAKTLNYPEEYYSSSIDSASCH